MIEKELKYFSNVFVIELTDMKVDKRFGLVYDIVRKINGLDSSISKIYGDITEALDEIDNILSKYDGITLLSRYNTYNDWQLNK